MTPINCVLYTEIQSERHQAKENTLKTTLNHAIIRVVLAIACLSIMQTGCTPTTTSIDDLLNQVDEISFPLDCRAEIVVPMDDLDREIFYKIGPRLFQIEETEVLLNTTQESFARLFKDIELRGEIRDPHVTITLNTASQVDPVRGLCAVDVNCVMTYADGRLMGTYQGIGTGSNTFPNTATLTKAYTQAFAQIIEKVVQQPDTLTHLASSAAQRPIPNGPTTPPHNSRYQAFTDAVVLVETEINADKTVKFAQQITTFPTFGTGFFIDDQGTLLTNKHLVMDIQQLRISYQGKKYPVSVIAMDKWYDLALLKADLKDTPFLQLVPGDTPIAIGDDVIAIGTPVAKKFEQTVSKGIISSFRNMGGYPLIQTDAAINKGNSGGPLIHLEKGRVVGVIAMMAQGHGIGFAIPTHMVEEFLEKNQRQDLIQNIPLDE